jgi:hypothetical protein
LSNRSLIEINHDFSHAINGAATGEFENVLLRYLGSNSKENAAALKRFGVRVFGTRHHSDGYDITWGGVRIAEEEK